MFSNFWSAFGKGAATSDDTTKDNQSKKESSSQVHIDKGVVAGSSRPSIAPPAPVKAEPPSKTKTDSHLSVAVSLPSLKKATQSASEEEAPYSRNILIAFKLLRYLMLLLLKFPFHLTKRTTGSFSFQFQLKSTRAIAFLMMNCFLSLILVLNIFNYFSLLLNYPTQEPQPLLARYNNTSRRLHDEEVYLVHRNNSNIISMFAYWTHVVLSRWALFFKRELMESYLTFWSSAVELFHMDVAKRGKVKEYMSIIIWSYIALNLLITILTCLQCIPVLNGAPAILAILTLRLFHPPIHIEESFPTLRYAFTVLFLYVRLSSHVYIFFYLLQCKFLENAFREWNERLKAKLFPGHLPVRSRRPVRKRLELEPAGRAADTSFNQLYKDYHCIVRVLDATDSVFSLILMTYYGAQIMATCFQTFHLYASFLNHEQFPATRQLDVIAIFLFIMEALIILIIVSRQAARVGVQANDGMEIIRAKGLFGRKSSEEAYFMLSMAESYGGYFETVLTGGKFFALDSPFIVAIAATSFTYMITVIQFTYIFKQNHDADMKALKLKGPLNGTLLRDLLENVEGTVDLFALGREF